MEGLIKTIQLQTERITALESQNARMKAALVALSPGMTWAECVAIIDAALKESP